MKTLHIVADSYDRRGPLTADYKCPCCDKVHTTNSQLKEYSSNNCFMEETCFDTHIVIWLVFNGKPLCGNVDCKTCKGTGKEVLFQIPEPCSECRIEKISPETFENWHLQTVGQC